MVVPIIKFLCSIIMAVVGLIFVKKISGSKENLLRIANCFFMSCLIVFPFIAHNMEYDYIYSIILYIITVVTYKYILNISYIKSTLSCGIMLTFIAILDFLFMCFLVCFIPIDVVRDSWYTNIISNIIVIAIVLYICYRTEIGSNIEKIVTKIINKKQTRLVFFFVLIMLAMSIILYISSENFQKIVMFRTNLLLFIIFFLMLIILYIGKNDYDKLSEEHDALFECVKVFEEWIEKEQFMRHEYKNQLAVLREMTKNKKVRGKIEGIIEELINIDENMVQELRGLPNGGLKGLLYYKIIVARNKNINIETDINSRVGKMFKKLGDIEIKILTKLIGVYFDNAIEAAVDTEKKFITIEVYNLNNMINIVISNTYNQINNLSRINEKGFTSKGEGRGNGLYFADKLIQGNDWLTLERNTINNIYVLKLLINTEKKQ